MPTRDVFCVCLVFKMSVHMGSVYLVPSPVSEKNNVPQKGKSVAIVAPQRSNSLDFLNFEEKRQLIASSLSLSDFLAVSNHSTKEIKDGVATVIVGKGSTCFYLCFGTKLPCFL